MLLVKTQELFLVQCDKRNSLWVRLEELSSFALRIQMFRAVDVDLIIAADMARKRYSFRNWRTVFIKSPAKGFK